MIKICIECSAEYLATKRNQKFCSKQCCYKVFNRKRYKSKEHKEWYTEYYKKNKIKLLEKHTKWWKDNRDKERINQRERARKRKLKAIEYKGGVCIDCKQIFPPCVLDFHHLDMKEKDKQIRIIAGKWEKVKIELDKCILLCANCHRIRHHEE